MLHWRWAGQWPEDVLSLRRLFFLGLGDVWAFVRGLELALLHELYRTASYLAEKKRLCFKTYYLYMFNV